MRETGWKIEGKTGQRAELSNVWEIGWKIEGMTGQRTELSNVWETGWKIEGMTDGKPCYLSPGRRPFRRTLVRTGRGR